MGKLLSPCCNASAGVLYKRATTDFGIVYGEVDDDDEFIIDSYRKTNTVKGYAELWGVCYKCDQDFDVDHSDWPEDAEV